MLTLTEYWFLRGPLNGKASVGACWSTGHDLDLDVGDGDVGVVRKEVLKLNPSVLGSLCM